MSWLSFSDIAKSAFSEAQKRIDKVLDIQEDGSPAVAGAPVPKPNLNRSVDSANLRSQSDGSSNGDAKRLSLSARKTNSGVNKKRGKPTKLGSSLTRNTEVKTSNPRVKSPSSSLATSPSESFSEIPLDDENDDSHHCQGDVNTQNTLVASLANHTETTQIPMEYQTSKSQTIAANLTNSAPNTDSAHFHNVRKEENGGSITSPAAASYPATTNEASQSPCGSLTTSSDIDILDHESTQSEASFASKMYEFDNSLHFIGGDSTYHHQRMSQDNFDSEASDIVRISGYCSSPLSMDGYENVAVFKSPDRTLPTNEANGENQSPENAASSTTFTPVVGDDSTDTNRDSVSLSSEEEVEEEHKEENEEQDENEREEPSMDDSQSSTVQADNPSSGSMVVSDNDIQIERSVSPEPDADKISDAPPTVDDVTPSENIINEIYSDEDGSKDPLLVVTSEMSDLVEEVDDSNIDPPTLEEDTSPVMTSEKVDPEQPQAEAESTIPAVLESQEVDLTEVTLNQPKANDDREETTDLSETELRFRSYEQQLLNLSMSNAKLSEENDNLRSEVSSSKLNALNSFEDGRRQFMETIENMQQKLVVLESEKSDLEIDIEGYKSEISQRLSNEQVQQILAEKEESIQGLLDEGEALSKQHLQQNNLIKKLRSKATEREASINSLTEKLDKSEADNKALKEKLSELRGRSTEDRGTAERLTEAYQERELRMSELANQLEDSEEKRRAAQATLDTAYRELAEMNKRQVALQSEQESDAKEREEQVRRRMQQEAERIRQDADHQKHMAELQMSELRDAVERAEAISTRKDDQWRKEIQDLQQRLQDSELRNHELSEGITESTRPLLRQMESLQSTHATQAKTWEALEKSLTSRLGDAQTQLVAAQEKERSAQMTLVDLRSRLTACELQLSDERKGKTELKDEVEKLRKKTDEFDSILERARKELAVKEQEHSDALNRSRRERLTLENQLDMEKVRAEVDRKKFQAQFENMQKEKDKLLWMSRSESITSSASMIDNESVASSSDTFNNLEAYERQFSSSGAPSGVYDSLRSAASGSTLLENLQSQLKQRDGEIVQLQGEINTLERTRASMAEEIVRLTNLNEELEETAKEVQAMRLKITEMKARQDAVLTMYGEKAEEAEELKLDLQDVKDMYRQQIDALLKAEATS